MYISIDKTLYEVAHDRTREERDDYSNLHIEVAEAMVLNCLITNELEYGRCQITGKWCELYEVFNDDYEVRNLIA